jgi:endonuclease/exonuclease/phosphatase family metal-dependent hydrolase
MKTVQVNVISHNIGGGTTYGTHLYSDGIAQIGSVLRLVQNNPNVDAVTLQECLRGEYDYWTLQRGWHGAFIPMTTADENQWRGGQDKGQAVLSPYPILHVDVIPLGMLSGVATGKEFNLLSCKIDHPQFRDVNDSLWVATTHLWSAGHNPDTGQPYSGETNDAIRELQARNMAEHLNPRVGWSRKYILTGDLNTSPKTLPIDHLHRVNRNGTVGSTAKFWEADQSHGIEGLQRAGRDTVEGRKIDYWFASHNGASPFDNGIDMSLHTASENYGDKHDKILHGQVRWTNVE